MKALRTTAFIAMISLCATTIHSASCTAISDGDWTDPATWSCGSQPGCGDLITIPAGITVTLDEHVNLDELSMPPCFDPVTIIIYGVLDFSTGKKMYLSCGSTVEVMLGGEIQPGVGGGSSNLLYICQQEEWKADDGPVYGYKLFGDPIPLAIDYVGMKVSYADNRLICEWTVTREMNISSYDIKISNDGLNWSEPSIIESVGNHQDAYTYHYEIPVEVKNSSLFYIELSYSNNDGKRLWLDTDILKISTGDFELYPNPVYENQQLNLRSNSGSVSIDIISIYSVEGKKVDEIVVNSDFNEPSLGINIDHLEVGHYILNVNGEKDKSYRFVKH